MTGSVMVAGATGVVGAQVVRLLLERAGDGPLILAPVRRALSESHPRLRSMVTDLSDPARDSALLEEMRAALDGKPLDAYVSCLGTTMHAAGSRTAFEEVDHQLVLRLAKLARELGARRAVLVSSVGADPDASNFYLRVKGRAEVDLAAMGFDRLDILQPSLLLAERSERRQGEAIARRVAPLANGLMIGPLRRYRAIRADTVAAAAVALLQARGAGVHRYRYDALVAAGRAAAASP